MKKLPKKVDLRKMLKDVPVYDQGGLGSSTACAMATAIAFEQQKNNEVKFLHYSEKKI